MDHTEKLLLGTDVAREKTEDLKHRAENLKKRGIFPKLIIVRVGERPDDIAYERGACKRMDAVGIEAEVRKFSKDISQDIFLEELKKINEHDGVHGILIFMPLPKQLDADQIKASISPEKDVDGISPFNVAKLMMGEEGFVPCTPKAVIELLKHYRISMEGHHIVVIGRSMVIGKPLSMLLLRENATVTICHSRTKNLKELCGKADIVICAIGKPKFLTTDYVKHDTIVIDVGINVDDSGNLCGDADFDGIISTLKQITPVPKGVGSVTTTVLAEQVLMSAEKLMQ